MFGDSLCFLNNTLAKANMFLSGGLDSFIERGNEVGRCAKIGLVLLEANCKTFNKFQILTNKILENQQADGGWRDVEETIWCIEFLKRVGIKKNLDLGYDWLESQRGSDGGWGQNSRDFSRIPLTSLMLLFHKELVIQQDINWLIKEVLDEVIGENRVVLTYKISLPLIAFNKHNIMCPQKEKLLAILINQQNQDGGFSPWKDHPIRSEIISSAYAALALCDESAYIPEKKDCINWLISSQLKDGSWPYHYIDHGTAIGALCISNILNR